MRFVGGRADREPLAELLELTETTAATVRKLEDRGLVEVAPQISERDPYAREEILPTLPLVLNPSQAAALTAIMVAMEDQKPEVRSRKPEWLLRTHSADG